MQRWSPSNSRASARSENGSASLEFLTAGLILLVPLVYLVIVLSSIQGGALAVEGAARQAARVYVQSPDVEEAAVRAARAVEFGLADHGIDLANATVRIDCESAGSCLTRQSAVTVSVLVLVPLPLVPDVLSLRDVTRVPVRASATQTVSRFWGGAG